MLVWMAAATWVGIVGMLLLELHGARKDARADQNRIAAERAAWAVERQRLMAAAIQPSNPVGAARIVKRAPDPDAPSTSPITPIGL